MEFGDALDIYLYKASKMLNNEKIMHQKHEKWIYSPGKEEELRDALDMYMYKMSKMLNKN